MTTLIIIIHVVMCLALIMIVLLQTGKGADMGAAFGGGGSQTLFGSSGASTFLSKATTVAAIIFMLTCFSLAYMSTHQQPVGVLQEIANDIEQPAAETSPNAAPETTSDSVADTTSDSQPATTDSAPVE